MADTTRHSGHVSSVLRDPLTSPMALHTLEGEFGTPTVFCPDSQDAIHPHLTPLTLRADAELRMLLQALTTRADIESLVGRLEASHRKEIVAVCMDITALTERMGAGEVTVTALERRLRKVEDAQTSQAVSMLTQQLHLEEIEDCSRRNSLRLRGLPEATGTEDLAATTLAIFRNIAGDTFPANMSFDRIYRALGPRSADPNHPRDAICWVHQYSHKEIVLRKA